MGGYGSGRWGTGKPGAKMLVESCRALDMKHLVREGLVGPGVDHAAAWEWLGRDGATVLASIRVEVRTGSDAGTARLLYSISGRGPKEVQDYPIPLEATTIGSGGRRWWFRCMASRDGGPACRRRARVLYLPPGGRVFACRACYGLAYESSRDSRKFAGMFASLGAELGMTGRDVKRVLEGRFRVERRLREGKGHRGRIEDAEHAGSTNPRGDRIPSAGVE